MSGPVLSPHCEFCKERGHVLLIFISYRTSLAYLYLLAKYLLKLIVLVKTDVVVYSVF